MQNLREWRSKHFEGWDTWVQERNQNKGSETKGFDENGADLNNKYRNECDSDGWLNRKTFEGHVQDVVLKVRTRDGKVISKSGLHLPCPLEKRECDNTSFHPYAYTWDAPDNCVLAIHRKEDVNMIKQGKNKYYNVSGRNNTSQYLFEVNPQPQVFPTNQYKSILPTNIHYTWLSTLVDLIWLLGREWDSQEEHNTYNIYYQPSVSSDVKLFVHKPESPYTGDTNPGTPQN